MDAPSVRTFKFRFVGAGDDDIIFVFDRAFGGYKGNFDLTKYHANSQIVLHVAVSGKLM